MNLRVIVAAVGLVLCGVSGPLFAQSNYVHAALSFSDLEGPKRSAQTDLSLLNGMGAVVAVGREWQWFRVEAEFQTHTVDEWLFGFFGSAASLGERVEYLSLGVNGYLQFAPAENWRISLGAGIGRADLDILDAVCREPFGCPAGFNGTFFDGSVDIEQAIVEIAFHFDQRMGLTLGFRRLRSERLGLVTESAAPFAKDRLEMDIGYFGFNLRF